MTAWPIRMRPVGPLGQRGTFQEVACNLHMVAAWWFDDSDDLSNSAKLSEFFAVKSHYVLRLHNATC